MDEANCGSLPLVFSCPTKTTVLGGESAAAGTCLTGRHHTQLQSQHNRSTAEEMAGDGESEADRGYQDRFGGAGLAVGETLELDGSVMEGGGQVGILLKMF